MCQTNHSSTCSYHFGAPIWCAFMSIGCFSYRPVIFFFLGVIGLSMKFRGASTCMCAENTLRQNEICAEYLSAGWESSILVLSMWYKHTDLCGPHSFSTQKLDNLSNKKSTVLTYIYHIVTFLFVSSRNKTKSLGKCLKN
jgi:hypothetical protein